MPSRSTLRQPPQDPHLSRARDSEGGLVLPVEQLPGAASSQPAGRGNALPIASGLSDDPTTTAGVAGPLAPFESRTYRMFWIASLFSNTGTWVHEIGAGWLMSTLDGSPQMVSAVRTSMALPMILLALPAGALSDRVDRRRLMLLVQCWLMLTATSLAVLTWLDWMTPGLLLVLTVVMGIGTVLHVPTWQASIPEIVDRRHLTQAIALGSISFNLARSVGPAVGGVLIATVGIWAAFGVNAVSFAVVFWAAFLWRRTRRTAPPTDSFFASMRDGWILVFSRGEMRRTLIRLVLFALPASSLWALLPLVAREQLAWDARGYGYLVGSIGLGAVIAAAWVPGMRVRLGADVTIVLAMLAFAIGLAMLGATSSRGFALAAALILGSGWMAVLTALNANAQYALPDAMRARGMACYLSALACAMAVGSLIWGSVAAAYSPGLALVGAAGALVGSGIVAAGLPPAGGRDGV